MSFVPRLSMIALSRSCGVFSSVCRVTHNGGIMRTTTSISSAMIRTMRTSAPVYGGHGNGAHYDASIPRSTPSHENYVYLYEKLPIEKKEELRALFVARSNQSAGTESEFLSDVSNVIGSPVTLGTPSQIKTFGLTRNLPTLLVGLTKEQEAEKKLFDANAPLRSEFARDVIADSEPILEGRQKLEQEFRADGLGGFNDQPATGPFGTLEEPVLIFSTFEKRMVGCKGGGDIRHHPAWFNLHEGKTHVCLQCGQAFKLITPDNIQSNLSLIRKQESTNRSIGRAFHLEGEDELVGKAPSPFNNINNSTGTGAAKQKEKDQHH